MKKLLNKLKTEIESKLDKNEINDIISRMYKTFTQAFLSSISIDTIILTEKSNLYSVITSMLIGALAAGISAVWNVMLKIIDTKRVDKLEIINEELDKSNDLK